MRLKKWAWVIPVLMICASGSRAQTCLHGTNESAEQSQRKGQALNAVRVINTAEAWYFNENKKYAPLEVLANSPAMEAVKKSAGLWGESARTISLDPKTDIVPGFEIHLTTNGAKYSVSVRDKTDSCSFSFFSDQQGVIFFGQPIGTTLVEEAKR